MSWDPVWEEIFCAEAWGKYPGEELIRFVARNFYKVADRAQVKMLEVGSGPGANLWYMAREGFAVYGIDGSQTAVDRAKARLNSECPGWAGEVMVGDICALPYPDDYFDAVIDNEAVYCNSLDDTKRIYAEMARVSKPGGKLYSRTFAVGSCGYNTGTQVGHNAWQVADGPLLGRGYARFTDLDEIAEMMQGFNISSVDLLAGTIANRQYEIREWVILGEKPSSKNKAVSETPVF